MTLGVGCNPLILIEASPSAYHGGTAGAGTRLTRERGGDLRRFSTQPHQGDGGSDRHARSLDVCLLHQDGEIRLPRNMNARAEPLLTAIAPDRAEIVGVGEGILTGDLPRGAVGSRREAGGPRGPAPAGPRRSRRAAPPLSRVHTGPGLGPRLSLVLVDALHDRARCPRVQAFASSCRVGTWAPASAGTREGPTGPNLGHASLPWACSAAAVLFLRDHPPGQQARARLENHQGQGQALTLRAPPGARAVYSRRPRAPKGMRRDRALCHPIGGPSPAPETNGRRHPLQPPLGVAR
jgi:hypothetical protein